MSIARELSRGNLTEANVHIAAGLPLTWVSAQKENFIICTHVDREHIHNHILLSAVDLDGKVWHDNKKTLTKAKDISDKLALKHDLSVIEKPQKGTMLS